MAGNSVYSGIGTRRSGVRLFGTVVLVLAISFSCDQNKSCSPGSHKLKSKISASYSIGMDLGIVYTEDGGVAKRGFLDQLLDAT